MSAVRATLGRPPAPPRAMADLQNEFSWSKSRHEKFKECRARLLPRVLRELGRLEGAHGSDVREIYVLKKLSSRWQWAGSLVHDALKRALSRAKVAGELPPLDRLLEQTRAKARAEWASSREKSYWREPSRIVGLVEHEYGEPVADAEWKRLYEQVIEGSLRAFYASPLLEEIRRTPRERGSPWTSSTRGRSRARRSGSRWTSRTGTARAGCTCSTGRPARSAASTTSRSASTRSTRSRSGA